VAREGVRLFHRDLVEARSEIETLQEDLAGAGFPLTPVRVLELLVWTQTEPTGCYRASRPAKDFAVVPPRPASAAFCSASVQRSSSMMTTRRTFAGVAAIVALTVLVVGAARAPAGGSADHPKIGFVPDGPPAVTPINRSIIRGLRHAARELGVSVQVRTPSPREGYAASFEAFAKQGYDLVIGFDGLEGPDLFETARRYPQTQFAVVDVSRTSFPQALPNLTGIVFKNQDAGYLVGYLAGLVMRREHGRVVSAVGGFPVPPVDQFIAGYRAGVHKANRGVRVVYGYSNDFLVPRPCAAVASRQIANGSLVVFDVAGACGLGALQTAKAHHVWGIGVDSDQSSLGPFILTSAVKRFDAAVFATARKLVRGRYRGGMDEVFGLRDGGVALGTVSPRVPRVFVARVRRIARAVATGRIVVPSTLP
jgi:basic membrane protein A and related proteins